MAGKAIGILLLSGLYLVYGYAQGISSKSGEISATETWSGIIMMEDNVEVTAGTLYIKPGTVVLVAVESSNVSLTFNGGAVLMAEGSENDRIGFINNQLAPPYTHWQGIGFHNTTGRSIMKYCDIAYALIGCDIETDTSLNILKSGPELVMEYCTVTEARTGVYASGSEGVTLSRCSFNHCSNTGVFIFDGTGMEMDHCYVYRTGQAGIILGGLDNTGTTVTIDHLTLYDVNIMYSDSPIMWGGYGIFCTNGDTSNTLNLTNSIVMNAMMAGLKIGGWTVNGSHNCFFTGPYGLINIEDGPLDGLGVEENPVFTDSANYVFTLKDGSPCKGAASDSTNIGAWQDGDTWPWDPVFITYDHFSVPKLLPTGNRLLFDITGKRVDWKRCRGVYLEADGKGMVCKKVRVQ